MVQNQSNLEARQKKKMWKL